MADIEDCLLEIERELHDGKKVLIGNGVVVNPDKILEAVDKIRNNLPDVIREARQIVSLAEARRNEETTKAQNIVANAQKRADAMLADHEIIRQAENEAAIIRAQAQEYQDNLVEHVKGDISILLSDAENTLSEALAIIKKAQASNRTK